MTATNPYFWEAYLAKLLSQKEMKSATQFQILDKAICISHHANALGKGMNSFILHHSALGK